MPFNGLLLLLLTVIASARIIDVAPRNCSQHYKIRAPIAKLKVESRKECSQYCDRLDNCRSFQVQTKQRQCTLLKRTMGRDAHHMMPKEGWTYKEKVVSPTVKSDTCINKAPKCRGAIKSFDKVEIIVEEGATYAWWGRDFAKTEEEDPRVFWMNGYSNQRVIYYYDDMASAWSEKDRKSFPELPFGCDGMQYLMYDGKIWCRRYNDRIINVFDINEWKMAGQIDMNLVDGYVPGYSSQCYYTHGSTYRSAMDVEVDETGIYVIWSRQTENCRISISKIDPLTYEVTRTFHTGFPRSSLGNTFMICGRMWGINNYNSNPSHLVMAFDTRTWNYTEYVSSYFNDFIYFPNEHGHLSFASYNPTDGLLYVYNNIRWGRKRPIFVDEGYEDNYWRNT